MKQRPCVCGHVPVHHDKRKSIPQGLMADYKVIFGCGWTGCGCPRYVEQPPVTGGSTPNPTEATRSNDGHFDTESSVSRQHYIDTGEYLTPEQVREIDAHQNAWFDAQQQARFDQDGPS